MELFITKKIGKRNYNFVVQGTDLFEAVMQSEHLSFDDVSECGICKSDDLKLTARLAEGKFKYVSVKCGKCRGDLTFGRTTADASTFFLRKKEGGERGELDWKAYTKETAE